MRQFCTRQPEACAVGSQAAVAFGQRAQAGAKMVYELINERASPRETGSIAIKDTKPAVALAAKPSQNTLTAADLTPAWRGAHREAQNRNGA
jgi:hypothetical protein